MYSHKKGTAVPEPVLTKLKNAKRSYGQLFLGTIAKLRKATVSFVMSVCPHRIIPLPLGGFSSNLIFDYFPKICRENLRFVVCFLLGDSPASEIFMPTFRNTLSVPSS